mmetsp:Transcript_71111/g.230332  ORF Transcript_71111/g.230332 Transcript_71111/m.230332 type:complete len:144 (-) Transcript_71111:305-736(-)
MRSHTMQQSVLGIMWTQRRITQQKPETIACSVAIHAWKIVGTKADQARNLETITYSVLRARERLGAKAGQIGKMHTNIYSSSQHLEASTRKGSSNSETGQGRIQCSSQHLAASGCRWLSQMDHELVEGRAEACRELIMQVLKT